MIVCENCHCYPHANFYSPRLDRRIDFYPMRGHR
jgi:hypothetical protein